MQKDSGLWSIFDRTITVATKKGTERVIGEQRREGEGDQRGKTMSHGDGVNHGRERKTMKSVENRNERRSVAFGSWFL
jgi:hypothetical protein